MEVEIELEEWQMEALSRPTENTLPLLIKYYSDPEVYEDFRKWHIETCGREPYQNCIVEIESRKNRERILKERAENESKTKNNKLHNTNS